MQPSTASGDRRFDNRVRYRFPVVRLLENNPMHTSVYTLDQAGGILKIKQLLISMQTLTRNLESENNLSQFAASDARYDRMLCLILFINLRIRHRGVATFLVASFYNPSISEEGIHISSTAPVPRIAADGL